MKKLSFILVIAIITGGACAPKKSSNSDLNTSNTPLKYNLIPSDSLIIKEFGESDIVFLGESHRKKQHASFVNNLLPTLYQHGIRIIFSEFANYSDTRLIDSILTAPNYDEQLARKIIHASGWDWAYKEYVDLYKAAWNLNNGLNDNQKPLRIIGLQPDINYSAITSEQDWDSPQKRQEYWNETDSTSWLAIIEKESLSKNQKALVYCGRHHAFSKFHHPIVIKGEFVRFENNREGTQLLNRHGKNVSTVLLHSFWSDTSNVFPTAIIPFNGVLDSIYYNNSNKNKAYGFQTNDSKLGNLIDSTSLYSIGRDTVRLKDICDGYIVLNPVCDLSIVSLIPDFIDESNFENSKIQDYPYTFYNHWTIQAMNDTIQKWYKMEKKYLDLMKQNCN